MTNFQLFRMLSCPERYSTPWFQASPLIFSLFYKLKAHSKIMNFVAKSNRNGYFNYWMYNLFLSFLKFRFSHLTSLPVDLDFTFPSFFFTTVSWVPRRHWKIINFLLINNTGNRSHVSGRCKEVANTVRLRESAQSCGLADRLGFLFIHVIWTTNKILTGGEAKEKCRHVIAFS